MTTRDFLHVHDRSGDELVALAESAKILKAQFGERRLPKLLEGRRLAMWWDGPGCRNPAAFELGIDLLGGIGVQIPGSVGAGEDLEDRGRYLGNWFDAIIVRTPELSNLTALAAATPAMAVNARTRRNHPCEILGDLAFLHSIGRDVSEPLNLVFVGDATNLCQSWMEAAAVLPITVRQVCPPGFGADVATWMDRAPVPVGAVGVGHELSEVLDDAHVLYTDCWPSGLNDDGRAQFAALRITGALLDEASPDLVFLPCPPVSRSEEVSSDAMEHRSCRVVEAKAWLLHAQNALLVDGLADTE